MKYTQSSLPTESPISPILLKSSENGISSPFRSRPYEFTFWPSSVNDLYPRSSSDLTSSRMSSDSLDTSLPRVKGTAQNEQNLSHPFWIGTYASKADAYAGCIRQNSCSFSPISKFPAPRGVTTPYCPIIRGRSGSSLMGKTKSNSLRNCSMSAGKTHPVANVNRLCPPFHEFHVCIFARARSMARCLTEQTTRPRMFASSSESVCS